MESMIQHEKLFKYFIQNYLKLLFLVFTSCEIQGNFKNNWFLVGKRAILSCSNWNAKIQKRAFSNIMNLRLFCNSFAENINCKNEWSFTNTNIYTKHCTQIKEIKLNNFFFWNVFMHAILVYPVHWHFWFICYLNPAYYLLKIYYFIENMLFYGEFGKCEDFVTYGSWSFVFTIMLTQQIFLDEDS